MSFRAIRALAGNRHGISGVGGPNLQRKCACGQHTGGDECAACGKNKQLLQRRTDGMCSGSNDAGVMPWWHDAAGIPPDLGQVRARPDEANRASPRIKLSQPGDRLEREADRVAAQVMRTPAWMSPLHALLDRTRNEGRVEEARPYIGRITPLVQRNTIAAKEPEDDEESEERGPEEEVDFLQLERQSGSTTVPTHERVSNLAVRIRALEGGGQPLDAETRAFFEPRFSRDFSRVRIHAGARAAELADAVQAKAFTYGRNIIFGAGEFAPNAHDGRSLLAHELTHTVQQERAGHTIQRKFNPLRGSRAVCARPPSPRRMGIAAHNAIQEKFLRGGRNRRKEVPLPYTDTSACKGADRMEPRTSRGRVDLALLEPKAGKVVVRLGEIKPYNVNGMSAGHGVMLCYERAIKRNADICKDGFGTLGADTIPFCRALNAFGKELELGSSIRWQPGPVTTAGASRRALGTVNLGGVIGYFCPGKLLAEEKKRAKRVAKKGAKKGTKRATKGALKKLVPGAAYAEVAMFATVLLAGCKPSFSGDGVDLDEAFFHVLRNGPTPNVEISEELKALLDEYPDLMERMRDLEQGKGNKDAAAREMLKLLEQNKDLIDDETLEFLVAAMEGSERPKVSQGGKDFRRVLEAVEAGAQPGTGELEPSTPPEDVELATGPSDATEQEGEGEAAQKETSVEKPPSADSESAPAAGKGGDGGSIPPELKQEIERRTAVAELFERVRAKVKRGETLDAEKARRFLEATRGLADDQLARIAAELAKLPEVDESTAADAPREDAISLVERMAKEMKAGVELTSPEGTATAPAEPTPIQMKWVRAAIRSLRREKARTSLVGRTRFAEPSSITEAVELGVGGTGHGGHAWKMNIGGKTQIVGAYVTLRITNIERLKQGGRTKVTWQIISGTLTVDEAGKVIGDYLSKRGSQVEVVGRPHGAGRRRTRVQE